MPDQKKNEEEELVVTMPTFDNNYVYYQEISFGVDGKVCFKVIDEIKGRENEEETS